MNVDRFTGNGWPALAGVGIGYGLALLLIFAAFFLLPYLVVSAL